MTWSLVLSRRSHEFLRQNDDLIEFGISSATKRFDSSIEFEQIFNRLQ